MFTLCRAASTGFAELRITVVTPFLDRHHGTERAFSEQLERLVREYDCEINVYAQKVEGLAIDSSQELTKGKLAWHRVPSIAGPHLLQFVWWFLCNTAWRKWRSRRSSRSSDELILSAGVNCFDADVIVVHVVFERLREISRSDWRTAQIRASFLRRLHRRAFYQLVSALERRVYSNKRVSLAAVSRRTGNHLKKYFRRADVTVIPNGVDTNRFCPSTRMAMRRQARLSRNFQDRDLVLLLIGNDWLVKGVPLILSAIAASAGLPFHLLAVGSDGPAPYRELANHLGIANRFQWERPGADVNEFYAAADVYVSPSREDSFGLPVLEAMACGLPVITSVFAGVSELIRNEVDGFIVTDPDDTLALAQVLNALYNDPNYRQRIGDAAARTAQAWTWDRNAKALWGLLQDVATKKGGLQS